MSKIGITTTSYLTKSLLQEILQKKLNNKEIAKMIIEGDLIKHHSYYKPTKQLLRSLQVIPDEIGIADFSKLAKEPSFTQSDIMEIFNCNRDIANIILDKYFTRRWNLYYRGNKLLEMLEDGKEVLKI